MYFAKVGRLKYPSINLEPINLPNILLKLLMTVQLLNFSESRGPPYWLHVY